jgi:riboflavin synthase
MRYCLPKGSIAVDGISLTLVATKSNTFSIYIIPHTLKNTTLGFKGPSDKVNVEFDLLAKLNEQKTYATKVT